MQIVIKIAQRVQTIFYLLFEQECIVRLVVHSDLHLQIEALQVVVVELRQSLVAMFTVRERHIQAILVFPIWNKNTIEMRNFTKSKVRKNEVSYLAKQ